jgi:cysteine desulfurase
LPVDQNGQVEVDAAKDAITDQTLLVSIQAANNEIGTLQPVKEIAKIAHDRGALVHCDAAQAVGKVPVDVQVLDVDLLSMSAHKFYGPKGIGSLFIRGGNSRLPLTPLYYGGGQEGGLRSGTANVPAIVGFGEACRLAVMALPEEAEEIAALRDHFELELLMSMSGFYINGVGSPRLPNTSSLTFPGLDADALLLNLPTVMMSTGSACTSGAIEPSHVLQAIGLCREDASSTIRASLRRFTTLEMVTSASTQIRDAVKALLTLA